MLTEWKQLSTVHAGGRVEIVVPDLEAGDVVEVAVRKQQLEPGLAERPYGLLKGKIIMSENFDAPLEEFEPYI
jgi:hypothetical protein